MEIIIIVSVTFFLIYTGYKRQCPRCKQWWGRRNLGRSISEKYSRLETKTVSDKYGANHRQKKSETEKIKVIVLYIEYLHSYSCKKCAHRWSTTKTVRYES